MISPRAVTLGETFRELKLSFDFELGEILNINKPVGWTSFDVVKKIRGQLNIKKVGHAGTLDPFATGVLLICTGRATKKVEDLMNLKKEYIARIEFGKTTDSYDLTGTIVSERSADNLELENIKQVIKQFHGEIYQTPPMYSAVKVNGERLYKLARRGEVVERKPRKIRIYQTDVIDFRNPFLKLRIVCSRGTYIRALANDMGEILGCGGYLTSLTRTRVGDYKLEDSFEIKDLIREIKH
ncbi:tRNA pseudouridine(55) synthase TruB [candidate division KSB1 bacterium]|nr:tRNA pseudouridine(55) synthase TruB [candidate division KSB1 bacterium]